jgi:hypothetical protein
MSTSTNFHLGPRNFNPDDWVLLPLCKTEVFFAVTTRGAFRFFLFRLLNYFIRSIESDTKPSLEEGNTYKATAGAANPSTTACRREKQRRARAHGQQSINAFATTGQGRAGRTETPSLSLNRDSDAAQTNALLC